MPPLDLVRTVAPADTPVSLAEVKEHLRVEADSHDEDFDIQLKLDAAVAYLDGYAGILGRCMMEQTWKLYLDGFPGGSTIRLPLVPVISVTSITYLDPDGASQTLATTVYEVREGPVSEIGLKYDQSWPSFRRHARSVAITFKAGWANRAAVPAAIKAAILLMVGAWYENREAVGEPMATLPLGAEALLAPFRTRFLG